MTTYLPRSAWTSTPRPTSDLIALSGPEGFAVHWPGTSAPIGVTTQANMASRLEGYRRFHVNEKGWADIAYQTGIDQNGRVWDLRGIAYRSAANGDSATNADWGAVLLLVGPGEALSPQLIEAVRDFRTRQWLARYPGGDRVVGHKDIRPTGTECPGAIVMAAVRAGTFTKPPTPPPPPEDDMPTANEIAAALMNYPVNTEGVTYKDAVRRIMDNTVRDGVRDVYTARAIAAAARGDSVEVARALADLEGTVFPGEGSAIGEPVTGPDPTP